MPFASWSLLHNASSVAIMSGSYYNALPICTAAKIECANLLVRSLAEYKFNQLNWDTIIHHVCMFIPCAVIMGTDLPYLGGKTIDTVKLITGVTLLRSQTDQIARVIMNMQITHVPLLFRCLRSIDGGFGKIASVIYYTTWFPTVCYRNYILFKYTLSKDPIPPLPNASIVIACSVLLLDVYWTPRLFREKSQLLLGKVIAYSSTLPHTLNSLAANWC